jgi:glycosyltransferase involved in cell wall biosynthesis
VKQFDRRTLLKISVVIPTFNRQVHTSRAIDSVLAQTRPVEQIIVVDDGSTDGTAEAVVGQFGSAVTLIRQKNAGVSAARNRGIREAQGEWIAFLDSDDIWLPTKIERQMEAIEIFGSQFGLCFTDNSFGGNSCMNQSAFEETGFNQNHGANDLGIFQEPVKRLLAGREPFFTSSLLVLRALLEALDGFDETLTIGEDTDMVFRLSFRTRFCFVAEQLVEVDRTPSRIGLCNLYSTRDDRKYDNFERRYTKWLEMPEVAATGCEHPIRAMLREFRYESTEAKLHQLRIVPAICEIRRLKTMGESYASVFVTLLRRKVAKMLRYCSPHNPRPYAQLAGKGSPAP